MKFLRVVIENECMNGDELMTKDHRYHFNGLVFGMEKEKVVETSI